MRVIAGSARSRKLAPLKGCATRPTADRVREALFSMLYSRSGPLQGKRALDLFAGSGALAIEALSRGAEHAWLVEKAPDALETIQKNLISCRLSDQATVISMDVRRALLQLKQSAPYNIIFIDPPYRQGLALMALQTVGKEDLLSADGIVVAETGSDETLPEQVGPLSCATRRRYGSTLLHFYAIAEQDPHHE